MALPVTIPNAFANATASIPLSQLDSNFSTLANVVNEINAGTQQLSNANVAILIVNAGTSAAPTITTTGDTNTGIFFPAADTIAFAEGGAEAMRIDSSGNVFLGTTSAFSSDTDKPKFGVASANASFDSLSTDADEACFENNGNAGVTIVSAASSTGNIYFGRPSFGSIGRIVYNHTDEALIFGTNNNADRMRIDSSGNVGIGVTPNSSYSGYKYLRIASQGSIGSDTNSNEAFEISNNSYRASITASPTYINSAAATLYQQYQGEHRWASAASGTAGNTITFNERARITSVGWFKASNSGIYRSAIGNYHEFNQNTSDATLVLNSTNASLAAEILFIGAARNTSNNSFYAINYYNDGASAYKFQVADSGNVTNANDSYGQISSDYRLKQDIVDAGSQWDDLKNIRIRKFRYRNDPDGHLQIGCIAQETEQVSPGLVDRRPVTKEDVLVNPELGTLVDDLEKPIKDEEGNITGYEQKVETDTEVLSFKSSILFWKATKALQEAMERIETLEAKVAALENA